MVQRGLIPPSLPLVPGMEGVGIIEASGSKVADSYPVGARVAYMAFNAKSYGQYTAISAGAAALVPEGISWEDATGAMMQGLTAHYLLDKDVFQVKKGDNVLIHAGAGGMGQLLTQVASYRGANVVTTVSTASKAELSKANGANVAVRYSDDTGNAKDWVQDALAASTDGKGFEVVYDSVGKSTWNGDKEVLKARGRLILYGDSSGSPDPVSPGWFAGKSLTLSRPVLFHYVPPGEFQTRAKEVFEWIQKGIIKFEYTKFPLADASKAHEAMLARKTTGKVLIEIPQ
ncbi:hypothetical protein BDQ17DRAFT_1379049 [Cyathus striatus]|nr:hypothetical protein BDQ17DRAFT_1379049 [Cyathus striatus]